MVFVLSEFSVFWEDFIFINYYQLLMRLFLFPVFWENLDESENSERSSGNVGY